MRMKRWLAAVLVCAGLAGCGVPRTALEMAKAQAAAKMPASDDEVRARLRQEAADWATLAGLLKKSELGGIGWVDQGFVDLVERTAAVAQREADLIRQGQDDPARNRAVWTEFTKQWGQVCGYLGK